MCQPATVKPRRIIVFSPPLTDEIHVEQRGSRGTGQRKPPADTSDVIRRDGMLPCSLCVIMIISLTQNNHHHHSHILLHEELCSTSTGSARAPLRMAGDVFLLVLSDENVPSFTRRMHRSKTRSGQVDLELTPFRHRARHFPTGNSVHSPFSVQMAAVRIDP